MKYNERQYSFDTRSDVFIFVKTIDGTKNCLYVSKDELFFIEKVSVVSERF